MGKEMPEGCRECPDKDLTNRTMEFCWLEECPCVECENNKDSKVCKICNE